jgi:hypothetical protein
VPPPTILVTGSDSRYFPLMREMIASVRAKPESASVDLGVLDCGLAPNEVAWCRDQAANVVEPDWDVTFGPGLSMPASFRAMTARPHLRRYFPGYTTYLWLDADVWVQDWSAIALFLEAAHLGDIALVPEVHRSYANFRDGREDFEIANGRAYADAFGAETAARLIRRPLNNAGVFAMSASSPAWETWSRWLADAATRSTNMIDQIALNAAIYAGAIREIRLPATCNWIAHLATPAWDEAQQTFVEPDPPFTKVGVLHLTLGTKWEPSLQIPIAGEPRRTIARPLRFKG